MTVAAQVDVWVAEIAFGAQFSVTAVIVEPAPTVTVVDPNFVVSCLDVAVIVAVPAPDGVNTPPAVIVPPVAVQFTAEL